MALSFRGGRCGKRNGLDLGEVELFRRSVDVEADDFALGIEVHQQALGDFPCLGAGRALEFDVEAVRFRVVVQLHESFLTEIAIKKRVVDGFAVFQL
jgi:hypothetical protein